MKDLTSWEFNVWEYSEEELSLLAHDMLRAYFEEFELDSSLLSQFVEKVEALYRKNPYHNFHHALDVTQFVYKMDIEGALSEKFDSKDRFCLLLAAIGHDLGHPGNENSFQAKFKTEIFEKYGPDSTLEKMHADLLIQIIRELNLFRPFPLEEHEKNELLITEVILATDLASHDRLFGKMKGGEIKDPSLLACLVLKCADLVQIIRAEPILDSWLEYLCRERMLQCLEAKKRGETDIPTANECHHLLVSQQSDFINQYARPLFQLLSKNFKKLEKIEERIVS